MENFEKLGLFYLGKIIDPSKKKSGESLLLYESKNFTTHAVCLGMTGSGKTGLGITIIEEGGLDKIPTLIIDPKGDLTNLLLTFPKLTTQDFQPWIDPADAERKGITLAEYAESTAKNWKEGLAEWGEGGERIQKLKDSVQMEIYTPASHAGLPISILNSFKAPSKELMLDPGALRERIQTLTSSLLGLLGIDTDPLKSRAHILVSTIISNAWNEGRELDIGMLIQQVQKPPFKKIGALDVETFFPVKERMTLAVNLNNLLASPGFQAWMEGNPLDIQSLLYTNEGKSKLSILSIAHLSDAERMFFVTLFLNEFISWMRRQSGTSSLRAMLYMDEIVGFFPPVANPPSKGPMITLLKQARAYGIGIILTTQNPVDLDYKGLSNCGTWFIGKLQTERDKARVLEGLQVASNGEVNTKSLNKMMASIGKRTFIMRSIYEKEPIVFQTRWTLSYLRGPLTLTQISTLMKNEKKAAQPDIEEMPSKRLAQKEKPSLPIGINEYFISKPMLHGPYHYQAKVVGLAKIHFVNSKNNIDFWKEVCLIASPDQKEGKTILWENAVILKEALEENGVEGSTYDELLADLMQEKNYVLFRKGLAAILLQYQTLTLYQSSDPNMGSKMGESEAEFRIRVTIAIREKRDERIKKLRESYEKKIATLKEKVRRSQERLSQKQQDLNLQKTESWLSWGTTLLGILLGRKVTKDTISNAGTSIRRTGRISKEAKEAAGAEQDYQAYLQQLEDLQAKMKEEIEQALTINGSQIKLESVTIRPKKSDISIEDVGIVWVPI